MLKLFPFLLFLFSHQSHDPAHAEDGSSRSRCCACGNTLLLQGEDGQPGSDPSLHKGQRKHTKTECHANLGLGLDLVFKNKNKRMNDQCFLKRGAAALPDEGKRYNRNEYKNKNSLYFHVVMFPCVKTTI